MGQTSKYAKEVWQQLQQEILSSHGELMQKLHFLKKADSFYNHLKSRQSELHISGLCRSDFKVGHFGKLISFRLMYVENGRIYNDQIFVPTAKTVSSRLISIDTLDTYSKHYVERLIERKGIVSMSGLKREIEERRAHIPLSKFHEKHGALDIEGALVALTRDMIQFSEFELLNNNQEGRMIHKSCLMREQLSVNKKEIVDFILSETNCELFVLARRNLPMDIEEARQAIAKTKQRLTQEPLRSGLVNLANFERFEQMRGDSTLIKRLTKTLQYYEK